MDLSDFIGKRSFRGEKVERAWHYDVSLCHSLHIITSTTTTVSYRYERP